MEWKNNNMMNNNMTKWTRIKLIININMMKIMKCKIDYLYINLIIYIKIILFFYFFMRLIFLNNKKKIFIKIFPFTIKFFKQ